MRHIRRIVVAAAALSAVAASVAAAQAAHGRSVRGADEIDPKLGIDPGRLEWTGTFHVVETDRTQETGTFDASSVAVIDETVKVDATTTTATSTYSYTYKRASTGLQCAITENEQLAGSYTGKVKGGRVYDQGFGGGRHSFWVPVVDYGVTGNDVQSDCKSSGTKSISHPWLGSQQGTAHGNYALKAPGNPGATQLQGSYTDQAATGNLTRTTQYSWNLRLCGEESGDNWVDRYPDSKKLSDLSEPFRDDLKKFLAALGSAYHLIGGKNGVPAQKVPTPIKPFIETTYRPDPRAYLMHYAFRVAGGKPGSAQFAPIGAAAVPVYQNSGVDPHFKKTGVVAVPICWVHRDPNGNLDKAASKKAAAEMRDNYHIHKFGAAFPSNHSAGKAADFNVFWSPPAYVENASGDAEEVRTGQDLFRVAATFGVKKHVGQCGGGLGKPDPPHWSLTGC